jgi:hypothetical protein
VGLELYICIIFSICIALGVICHPIRKLHIIFALYISNGFHTASQHSLSELRY